MSKKAERLMRNAKSNKFIIYLKRLAFGIMLIAVFNYASCKYSFRDSAPIPPEIKTFRVAQLGNQAPYVDPQLAPQLTEALKQKIISNSRLRQTNDDDASYDINGYISNYVVTTTGISGNTASQNRLTVTFHIVFKNTVDNTKNMEADVSNNFDYNANLSLNDAATALNTQIIANMTDMIYNKIFSNW
jgi:outer membrane lipopolysaccharide assembly protein LptE/RlpB